MEEAEAACPYSPSYLGMCDYLSMVRLDRPGVNSELLPAEDSIEPLPSAFTVTDHTEVDIDTLIAAIIIIEPITYSVTHANYGVLCTC